MGAITGRDRSKTALQMLAAPGERRVIGGGKVEAHVVEPGLAEARRLIEKHGYWRRKEELEDAEAAARDWPPAIT